MIFPRPTRTRFIPLVLALMLAGCASAPRGPVQLNLIGLNDFHGNLEPSKYSYKDADGKIQTVQAGGIEALSGTLRALRREDKDLLFVGAGDLVGASPALSSMWADEPSIEAMNLMGLNDSSLGNHEFDAGRQELLRKQNGGCASATRADKACQLAPDFGGAKFHYLAANVTDSATGQLLVPGWRIEDVKGVKVGVIGAVLQGTPSVAVSWSVRGLSFGDEATAINRSVQEARAKGAQVFVVLIHEGGFAKGSSPFQQDCAHLEGPIVDIVKKLDPAVRVVFSGHSHTGYLCKVDGRVVSQAASMGHLLTRVQMTVDPRSGKVEAVDAHNVLVKPGEYEPDPKVSALLARVKARSTEVLATPIANIGVPLVSRKNNDSGESPMGDLIGDAIVAAMREHGVQIGFMNPGGIRKDLEAGSDHLVSFGQAQAVLPFGNTLVVMDMTGAQLRALLEQQWDRPPASETSMLQVSSALSYRWDESKPKGSRVVSVKVNGVPLDESRTYRVVANNFLAEGGDEFPAFKQATNKTDTQMRDLDALIAYLKQHPGAGVPAASLAPSARIEKVKH